jgi:gamma-glutamylcysteine synthetase
MSFSVTFSLAIDHRDALTSVQRVASGFSLEDVRSRGADPVHAEHLLSTGELVDVAIVIFLIGNPMPVIALVQVFERYVQGLEMVSQLEFAFASISTIIQRIREVNAEDFLREAGAAADGQI